MTFMPRFLVVTALVCAPLFAHAQDAKPAGTPPAAVQDKTLTVFAAASMKNALDEATDPWGVKVSVRLSCPFFPPMQFGLKRPKSRPLQL